MPETALERVTPLLGLTPAPTDGSSDPADLGVLALRGRDRFVLPLGTTAATAAGCLAYQGLRTAKTRAVRRAAAAAASLPGRRAYRQVLRADTGPGSLLAHLADLLGEPTPMVAVGLGTVDTVWKPTLQVFRPDGTPLAFVKVGLGPVADRLVAREVEVLRRWNLAEDPRLVVPRLLADSSWQHHRLAVVAPLPTDVRRLPHGAVSAWAVRALEPSTEAAPLQEAPWWTARVAAAPAATAEVLATIADRHRSEAPAWARWHGDWVPWNQARCGRGLVAWDWEYSEPDAPAGLDEVHARYQHHRVLLGAPVATALAEARRHSPTPWLADAHAAMVLTRADELSALADEGPADHDEILAAVRSAIR